jgi:hypothetical protein
MALEPPDSQTPPPEIKRPIRSANHPLHRLTPHGALPARPSRRTMPRSAKDTRRWLEGLNKHDIHQNPARDDPGSRARVTLTDHPIPLPARGGPPPRRAHGPLRGKAAARPGRARRQKGSSAREVDPADPSPVNRRNVADALAGSETAGCRKEPRSAPLNALLDHAYSGHGGRAPALLGDR